MLFKAFKIGSLQRRRVVKDEIVHEIRQDRCVTVPADSINVDDKQQLSFKKDRNTVGFIRSGEWDFVIPEDGEVIYNDHGSARE